ncbi:hypothetical protein [Leuconostoc gasicomitatum]|uniref:hypothetical protein n=1 Tax=Leuconostoc gasicomitatum TaxID=115778 RepID=UPI001CC5BF17|nr:hypothetical protein [Leuconostoc gasicomitatum]MBZ5969513.1 hypothetical protein [Leuconostoc gasicomitatum]
MYGKAVGYDSEKNDSDRKIWKSVVEIVKNSPEEYFTKNGNWRKRIAADTETKTLKLI